MNHNTTRAPGMPDGPPTFIGAVYRGICRVCPNCGVGRLFSSWFRMNDGCEACGFSFHREPGYYLGSTYINYGITAVTSTWTFVIGRFVAGLSPTVLVPIVAGFSLFFPLFFFSFARSLWLSIDTFFERIGRGDAPEEGGESTVRESP